MKRIYLDHAATTRTDKEVVEVMLPYLTDNYGNPSSIYTIARENKTAIEKARESIAEVFNARNTEIYFTSGGTESDNWAIKGIASYHSKKGKHIIVSSIEHFYILNTVVTCF